MHKSKMSNIKTFLNVQKYIVQNQQNAYIAFLKCIKNVHCTVSLYTSKQKYP